MRQTLCAIVLGVLTLVPVGACDQQRGRATETPSSSTSSLDKVSGTAVSATLDPNTTDVSGAVTLAVSASWSDGSRIEWIPPTLAAGEENQGVPVPEITRVHTDALRYENGRFSQTARYVIEPVLPGSFLIEDTGIRVDLEDGTRRVCRAGTLGLRIESVLDDPDALALTPSIGFPEHRDPDDTNTPVLIAAIVIGLVSLTGVAVLVRRSGDAHETHPLTPALAARAVASDACSQESMRRAVRLLDPIGDGDPSVSELVALLEHALYSGRPARVDQIHDLSLRVAHTLERRHGV